MPKVKKLVSIVVPVFNEEKNVQPLYDAVTAVMATIADRYNYEFVFTDNHSTDRSFSCYRDWLSGMGGFESCGFPVISVFSGQYSPALCTRPAMRPSNWIATYKTPQG